MFDGVRNQNTGKHFLKTQGQGTSENFFFPSSVEYWSHNHSPMFCFAVIFRGRFVHFDCHVLKNITLTIVWGNIWSETCLLHARNQSLLDGKPIAASLMDTNHLKINNTKSPQPWQTNIWPGNFRASRTRHFLRHLCHQRGRCADATELEDKWSWRTRIPMVLCAGN